MKNEIDRLLAERPISVNTVLAAIQKAARRADPKDLPTILKLANMDDVGDQVIAIPALATLPAWHYAGLDALRTILEGVHLHGDAAQRILFTIAAGDDLSAITFIGMVPGKGFEKWYKECRITVDEKMIEKAQSIIREVMLNQSTNLRLRERLFQNLIFDLMGNANTKKHPPTVEYFFKAFTDTRLILNQSLIDQFKKLIDLAPEREEELHRFLFEHPIFLDPLAIEIRSKHELGSEFITDFVLKRINDEYVLVEIEKSTSRIFTKKGVFHSELTKAMAQVRDFQSWIHYNIAYAREKLLGIRRPEGMIVIGRRLELNQELEIKMDEENYSRRGHMKIVTFDDLLEQARVVYANILSRPLRFKAKKKIAS